MGRHKDENLRKIQQSGKNGSYHLTLPVRIMRELKWKEGQKVVTKRSGRRIVISDWLASPERKSAGGGNKFRKI